MEAIAALTASLQAQAQANLYALHLTYNQWGKLALKLLESIEPLPQGPPEAGKGDRIDVSA